jgi:hypothetical protein
LIKGRHPVWTAATVVAILGAVGLGLVMARALVVAPGISKVVPAAGLLLLIGVIAACLRSEAATAVAFEVVLAVLMAGTIIRDRAFAHISVSLGTVPLYATDFLLALLLICIALQPTWREGVIGALRRSGLYFGPYLAWGTLMLALSLGRPAPLVLRDYALFYLVVFVAIGYFARTVGVSLRRLGLLGLAACIVVFIHGSANLLTGNTLNVGYGIGRALTGQAGMYLGIGAMLSLAMLPFVKGTIRFWLGLFMALAIVSLFFSESRSAWIACSLGLIVVLVLGRQFRIRLPYVGEAVAGSAVILVALSLSIAGLSHASPPPRPSPVAQAPTPTPLPSAQPSGTPVQVTPSSQPSPSYSPSPSPKPPDIGGSFGRLGSGLGRPEADPTVVWRLAGWQEALRHIQRNPITGDGFGSQFSWQVAGRLVENYPHNTYLTIALKSGIPGVLLLVAPLMLLGWRALKVRARFNTEASHALFLGVTASLLALLVFGFYNLLFESPFLAWPTWALIGLALAMSDRLTPQRKDSKT